MNIIASNRNVYYIKQIFSILVISALLIYTGEMLVLIAYIACPFGWLICRNSYNDFTIEEKHLLVKDPLEIFDNSKHILYENIKKIEIYTNTVEDKQIVKILLKDGKTLSHGATDMRNKFDLFEREIRKRGIDFEIIY